MIDETSRTYRGGCLCGSVRYEVNGSPVVVAHCHCINCQKASGSGHSTGAMFRDDQLRLTGNTASYKYKANSGHEVTRVFCPACSSSILGRDTGTEGFSTITLGTLDDPFQFEPQVTVFARNRKAWDIMDGSLPTFDAQPDWKPPERA
jgi:hypothetical protein